MATINRISLQYNRTMANLMVLLAIFIHSFPTCVQMMHWSQHNCSCTIEPNTGLTQFIGNNCFVKLSDNYPTPLPFEYTQATLLAGVLAGVVFLPVLTIDIAFLSILIGVGYLCITCYLCLDIFRVSTILKMLSERTEACLRLNDVSTNSSLDTLLIVTYCVLFVLVYSALIMQSYQSETSARLDFLWKLQATEERIETEKLQRHNRQLLENILPKHMTEYFLTANRNEEDLYHEARDSVCVMFATITNFNEFYTELEANNEGVECLRVLNEIMADFDELMNGYPLVEKIKTISTTYMAAAGLYGAQQQDEHVTAMAQFAMALQAKLYELNEHSFNSFRLRIGLNVGPVVAGVIGARKPHYDIWGNTVNVASRMDSSGIDNKIQMTAETAAILKDKGFKVEQRGTIIVKGKGEMTTYFLTDPPQRLSLISSDSQNSIRL